MNNDRPVKPIVIDSRVTFTFYIHDYYKWGKVEFWKGAFSVGWLLTGDHIWDNILNPLKSEWNSHLVRVIPEFTGHFMSYCLVASVSNKCYLFYRTAEEKEDWIQARIPHTHTHAQMHAHMCTDMPSLAGLYERISKDFLSTLLQRLDDLQCILWWSLSLQIL